MRVLFASTRGAGHFYPIVPYVEACIARGHDVSIAAPEDIRAEAERIGATFRPFGHPGDAVLRPVWDRVASMSFEESNATVLREIFATLDAEASLPLLDQTFLAWRPDVVVRESSEFGSAIMAEKHGVPHVRIGIGLSSLEEITMTVVAEAIDALRKKLGMHTANHGALLRRAPYFTVVPSSFEDPKQHQPETTHRVREPRIDAPFEPLPAWWGTNDAPLVYITFGSVAGAMPMARAAYRAALDAVAELPVRALLTTGRGADLDALGSLPRNVHVEAWIPQYRVLRQSSAVICHGGSGTVFGALAAGCPLVIVPLFADQPLNAAQAEATGVGLSVEPEKDLLRTAIDRVLTDDRFRVRAEAFASEIGAQAPMSSAVDVLEALARR
jgi:UDP:flavonoid glycosyltransferase YjiC (YdhE family)